MKKEPSALKGTTSAKQMPRGFELLKGPNQKPSALTHNKCKTKNLRPSAPSAKESKTNKPRKNRKTDARKGGEVFLSEPSASIIRQPPETTARKKGGRHFFKKTKFARVASTMKKITFRRPPPSNKPLERGGRRFSPKNITLVLVTSGGNNLLPEGHSQQPT